MDVGGLQGFQLKSLMARPSGNGGLDVELVKAAKGTSMQAKLTSR